MKAIIPFYKIDLELFNKQQVGQSEIGKLIGMILFNQFFS